MPPSISLEEGNDFVNRMRMVIKDFPEIETVVSQQGRPDDGTDATGFFNAEFFAPLKPAKGWRKGVSKDKLIEEVNERWRRSFPASASTSRSTSRTTSRKRCLASKVRIRSS